MRELTKEEADEKCEFMYIECECGFHFALDATYLDQVGDIVMNCPACDDIINTGKIDNENPSSPNG